MSTTSPPARFITSTGNLRRQASLRALLCSSLIGLLLVTASCGDLQDPASGAQGGSLLQQPVTPVSQQQTEEPTAPDTDTRTFPGEPAPSLPLPETAPLPTELPLDLQAQDPTRGALETKAITFEWNPSPSGNAAGYIVRVSAASALAHYTFKTGQETRLSVELPTGNSYIATVLAYNSAGESLPAEYIRFDLF